jgi:outer membrane protein OmpA-like peptidoglycan-associated protein
LRFLTPIQEGMILVEEPTGVARRSAVRAKEMRSFVPAIVSRRHALFAAVLALQAPSIGSARAVPEHVESSESQPVSTEPSAEPRRHPAPEPAGLEQISRVRFADGQEKTVPGSIRTLRSVQRMLVAHPEVLRLRVEGHADDSGDPCFNLEVSKRRVRGVVRWLIANGVAAERLELLACGRRYVDADARSQAARADNRRVELSVSDPAQGTVVRDRCDPIALK